LFPNTNFASEIALADELYLLFEPFFARNVEISNFPPKILKVCCHFSNSQSKMVLRRIYDNIQNVTFLTTGKCQLWVNREREKYVKHADGGHTVSSGSYCYSH
jgi:hypothetical protein